MGKDTAKTVKKQGQFTKNDPRINLEGRPKGTNNFETDFDEAVDEIAKENGMTRSEARKLLLKVAFKNAKEGNYSFYKDIHDRIYGQATQRQEVKADVIVEDKIIDDETFEKIINAYVAKRKDSGTEKDI